MPERTIAPSDELIVLGLRAIRVRRFWRWWDSDHALPAWIQNTKTGRWMRQARLSEITPFWFGKLLEQERIIPDLSSPCVLGWVEHLVCEACEGLVYIEPRFGGCSWLPLQLSGAQPLQLGKGRARPSSKAEALVVALECAEEDGI